MTCEGSLAGRSVEMLGAGGKASVGSSLKSKVSDGGSLSLRFLLGCRFDEDEDFEMFDSCGFVRSLALILLKAGLDVGRTASATSIMEFAVVILLSLAIAEDTSWGRIFGSASSSEVSSSVVE